MSPTLLARTFGPLAVAAMLLAPLAAHAISFSTGPDDEISGVIVGDPEAKKLRFILSAIPITDESGQHVGALEIQRNVTDEAEVQVKYQEMLETEARERERLATQIRARTKELLETNQLLLKTQKELLAYKKGLVV